MDSFPSSREGLSMRSTQCRAWQEAHRRQEPERRWQAGGANLACGGRNAADVVQAATNVGWDRCDVVHELEPDVLDVDQLHSGTTLTRHGFARNERNFCWTSSVADAVSLIGTSSQKKGEGTGWMELRSKKEEGRLTS